MVERFSYEDMRTLKVITMIVLMLTMKATSTSITRSSTEKKTNWNENLQQQRGWQWSQHQPFEKQQDSLDLSVLPWCCASEPPVAPRIQPTLKYCGLYKLYCNGLYGTFSVNSKYCPTVLVSYSSCLCQAQGIPRQWVNINGKNCSGLTMLGFSLALERRKKQWYSREEIFLICYTWLSWFSDEYIQK